MPPIPTRTPNQGWVVTVGSSIFHTLAIAATRPQAIKPGIMGMKILPTWRKRRWTGLVWRALTLARAAAAGSRSGSTLTWRALDPVLPETAS